MNIFLTILMVVLVVVGLLFVIKALRNKEFDGDKKTLAYKGDLPILPRDEREQEVIEVAVHDEQTTQETEADALSSLATVASQNSQAERVNAAPTNSIHETGATGTESFAVPSRDFTQNSPVLDSHLDAQQTFDKDHDPLLNAEQIVTMIITPINQHQGLSGKTVLEIARAYGLKHGVMNMYHRHEREDGTGCLWFSMLGVTYEGTQAFDLLTLPDTYFTGLTLFLPLPHPQALRGFDSMVQVAQTIAKDINANVHDEEGFIYDATYLTKLRARVADYR